MQKFEFFLYGFFEEGIKNVNFEFKKGEVVLFTKKQQNQLWCLNRLILSVSDGHLSGKLSINGKDYSSLKKNELNIHIGSSVFHNLCSQFFTDDTISELVFPMENYGWSKAIMEKKLTHLTEEFGLENLLDKNISFFRTGSR